MSGPDIFISYCRQERAVARLFAESLTGEGLKVWWDAVLHSGETFDEVIERNLRAAKAVLVLWSPQSVTSRWVRAEATQADRANKLVPVIIEPCNLPIIFELTHTTDLAGWEGDRSDHRWQSLIHDLRRLVGPASDDVAARSAKVDAPEAAKSSLIAADEKDELKQAKIPEPANEQELETGKKADAASEDELFRALERLARKKASVLEKKTQAEQAQEEFFKRSDEYRDEEGEEVHCLRRVHADESEPYYVVKPSGLKIGRTAPADIVVSEPSVSREHCVVEMSAGKLRVMDLNSTNGTYVDNKRIGRAEMLGIGSVLRVGNVSFEHVVRTRAEVQQQAELSGVSFGSGSREPRIARYS